MKLVLLFIFSYLLGAIPVGFIAGKMLKGIDIRRHGSGNPGATNAFRVLGPVPGVITFILDALKGCIPVLTAMHITGNEFIAIGAGLCAITGHMYTVFLGFKGGKGVATSAGVFGALLPAPAGLALAAFAAVFAATGYVSAGSIVAAVVLPLAGFFLGASPVRILCAALVAIVIIFQHTPNIRRLINGTENKISSRGGNT